MAKPKRPRIGSKPRTANKYMVEVITQLSNSEQTTYHQFGKFIDAMEYASGLVMGEQQTVSVYRMDYILVRRK